MTEHNLEDELNESEKWLVDGLNKITRPTTIPEWITEDYTIKSGVYDIFHNVYVQNSTLTIEKGVTLNFGIGNWIVIGTQSFTDSRIVTEGTRAEPVILQAKITIWGGIELKYTMSDNIFKYTTIRNGKKNCGGGINAHNSQITLEDCLIEKCEGKDFGGGLNFFNAVGKIENTTIIGNRVKVYGGGLCSNNSSIQINNGIIKDNKSDEHGGGVDVRSGSSIVMKNTTIKNNNSEMFGGGICIENAYVDLVRATIMNNRAKYGGGIFHWENCSLRLENSIIKDNYAEITGGGIDNRPSSKITKYGINSIFNNKPENIYETK